MLQSSSNHRDTTPYLNMRDLLSMLVKPIFGNESFISRSFILHTCKKQESGWNKSYSLEAITEQCYIRELYQLYFLAFFYRIFFTAKVTELHCVPTNYVLFLSASFSIDSSSSSSCVFCSGFLFSQPKSTFSIVTSTIENCLSCPIFPWLCGG